MNLETLFLGVGKGLKDQDGEFQDGGDFEEFLNRSSNEKALELGKPGLGRAYSTKNYEFVGKEVFNNFIENNEDKIKIYNGEKIETKEKLFEISEKSDFIISKCGVFFLYIESEKDLTMVKFSRYGDKLAIHKFKTPNVLSSLESMKDVLTSLSDEDVLRLPHSLLIKFGLKREEESGIERTYRRVSIKEFKELISENRMKMKTFNPTTNEGIYHAFADNSEFIVEKNGVYFLAVKNLENLRLLKMSEDGKELQTDIVPLSKFVSPSNILNEIDLVGGNKNFENGGLSSHFMLLK